MSRGGRFRWGPFGAALLASLAIHVLLIIPRVVLPLMERREAPIEVSYVPEVEPGTSDDARRLLDKKKDDEERKKKPKEKRAEREKVAEKKPEKKLEPPKPPPPEVAQIEKKPEPPKPPPPPIALPKPPPPPPPLPKVRMKMVDQDQAQDEPDNLEAKYLAQKNHRAQQESRAMNTNLVRNVEAPKDQPPPSEKSDNKLPNVGMAKRKIAELEERKGKPHELVRSKPLVGDDGKAPRPTKPGKLSMRGLVPKAAEEVAGERQREGLELDDKEKGPLPAGRVGEGGERAQAAARGGKPKVKLTLTPEDYDHVEGESVAEKERRDAARAESSHPAGRWARVQRQMAMMRSSLENFTPEVRPGNQAELGTRAHPFAAYIAQVHRGIHKLWADGFIADIESKGISNPYNDMTLWTQVEIVIRPDGTLAKAPTIVRPSGYTPFDVAAMETVMEAAPFPPPPAAIKSANGKVYIDWRFHRDDRLCGTLGVDPHILTDPAEGDVKQHDTSEVGKQGALPPSTTTGSPPLAEARPSSMEKAAPLAHLAPEAEPGESAPAAPPSSSDHVPDEARRAAEGWFEAYVRGDAGWLAGWSAAPFSAGGTVAAKDGAAVKSMYAMLLAEATGDRRLDESVQVYTPIGIRAKLGSLPPGGDEDTVYALGRSAGEQLVLLLRKSNAGWRVAGLDR